MINTNCNGSGSESAGTSSMDQNSNGTAFSGTPEPKGSTCSRSEIHYPSLDNHGNMYESKQNRKLVRFVTVIAYMFAVSLAAIVLSLYYFFLWDPCMQQTLSDPVSLTGPGGFGGADAFRGGSRKRIASHGHSRPMSAFVQPIVPPSVPSKPFEPYAVAATQQQNTLLALDAISYIQSASDSNEDIVMNNETDRQSPTVSNTHSHGYADRASAILSAQATEPLPTPLALWLLKRRISNTPLRPTDIVPQLETHKQNDGSIAAGDIRVLTTLNEHEKKQQKENAKTDEDETNTVISTMENASRIANNSRPLSVAKPNITVIDSPTKHDIQAIQDRGIHKLATPTVSALVENLATQRSETRTEPLSSSTNPTSSKPFERAENV